MALCGCVCWSWISCRSFSFSGKLERSDTAIAKCDQFCSLKIRGEIINIPSTPTGKSALNCQTSKTRGEIINSCYSGWEISDFDAKHPIKVQIIMSDTRIICFRKSLQNEFPTTNLFCGLQRAATTWKEFGCRPSPFSDTSGWLEAFNQNGSLVFQF